MPAPCASLSPRPPRMSRQSAPIAARSPNRLVAPAILGSPPPDILAAPHPQSVGSISHHLMRQDLVGKAKWKTPGPGCSLPAHPRSDFSGPKKWSAEFPIGKTQQSPALRYFGELSSALPCLGG